MVIGGVQGGSQTYARGAGQVPETEQPQSGTGGTEVKKTGGATGTSAGAGSAGNMSATPDVRSSGATGGSATQNNVTNSINALAPEVGSKENLQNLGDATNMLQKTTAESNAEKLKADAEKQKQLAEEKKAQADEAAKKAEEARKQAEGTKWWGVFKSVLNWIGSVVQIAAGIALIATGAGAAVGALMLAGGIAGLVNAIDSTVKQATGGLGILGSIAKKFGASEETAAKWDLGLSIAMSVVQVGTSIATFWVNPAALATGAARVATLTSTWTGIATSVVNAAGDAISAAVGYDITGKKAGAMNNQAQAQAADSAMKSIEAALMIAMKDSDKISKGWSAMLDDVQTAMKNESDTSSTRPFKA